MSAAEFSKQRDRLAVILRLLLLFPWRAFQNVSWWQADYWYFWKTKQNKTPNIIAAPHLVFYGKSVMISSKASVSQNMTWPTTEIAALLPPLPYVRSSINSGSVTWKHIPWKITLLFPLQHWDLWPYNWRSDYHVPTLWPSVWLLETKYHVFGFKGMYDCGTVKRLAISLSFFFNHVWY